MDEEIKKIRWIVFIIIIFLFFTWIGYRAGFNGVERMSCSTDAERLSIYLEYQMQDLNNTIQKVPYHKLIAPEVSKLVYYYFVYPMVSREFMRDMIREGLVNITREKLEWNDLDASVNYPDRYNVGTNISERIG